MANTNNPLFSRGAAKAPSITTTFDYNAANGQLNKVLSSDMISNLTNLMTEYLNNEVEDISGIWNAERFQMYLYTLAATVATNNNLAQLNLIAPVYKPTYTVKSTKVEKVKNDEALTSANNPAQNERLDKLEGSLANIEKMLAGLAPKQAKETPKEAAK